MIDYQLAKALKEAWFIQNGKGEYFEVSGGLADGKTLAIGNTPLVEGKYYLPTLEELIDACGDEFLSLDSPQIGDDYKNGYDWAATGMRGKECLWTLAGGKTPSEAVARLWLAINKK